MQWSGKFDADGNPTLTFHISADDQTQGVEVTGIIDTGFTGFVLLPMQYALSLGLTPKSTTRLRTLDANAARIIVSPRGDGAPAPPKRASLLSADAITRICRDTSDLASRLRLNAGKFSFTH